MFRVTTYGDLPRDLSGRRRARRVAVVSVIAERQVYYGALRRITKQDFGTNLSRWREHLKLKPSGD